MDFASACHWLGFMNCASHDRIYRFMFQWVTREFNKYGSALLSTVHWLFQWHWQLEECFMKKLHTEFNIGSSFTAAATLFLRLCFLLSTTANPMASASKATKRTNTARIANLFCRQKSFRERLVPSVKRLLQPEDVSFAVLPRTIDWSSLPLSSALTSHERLLTMIGHNVCREQKSMQRWSSWLWRGFNTAEVGGSIPLHCIFLFASCYYLRHSFLRYYFFVFSNRFKPYEIHYRSCSHLHSNSLLFVST